MRYEFPSFRIDKKDFFKGNNSYDNYPEGGAFASTVGMNVFSKPGLLANGPVLGSVVNGGMPKYGAISWGIGSGASAPSVMAVYSDETFHATFALMNVTTGSMSVVGSVDSTRSYKLGITDTVFYNGNFFTTSETDICMQAADLTSRTESWWIGTKGKSALTAGIPHPLLVYESIMYIADGRYLHKVDGTDVSTQVFDCPPDHIITAMVEWNGLIYMVAEPYKSLDGTVHGLAQMFSWDGLSDSWYEQYFLDYRINALYVYKNKLYGWTNQFMGLWTGAEMAPVRPVTAQVFKSQITANADSLIYADGLTVVRYGAPYIPGLTKKFYNFIQTGTAYNFAGIISVSDNNLVLTARGLSAGPNYLISNVNSPSASAVNTFEFNARFFTKPVKVRGIVIETEAIASGQSCLVGYVDDKGTTNNPTKDSGTFAYATTAMAGKTRWVFDVMSKEATRNIRPKITLTGGLRIRSIDYLYEASEDKQNA